jgi:hypothetical protein
MELGKISNADEDFLCRWYKVNKVNDLNLNDLINTYNSLKNQNPASSFLFTLDNINQACYTSMHSTMSNNLDDTNGYDLSSLNASCFEDGTHKGCLSNLSEFFIRKDNFKKGIDKTTLSNVYEKGISLFHDSIDDFKTANDDVISIIDKRIYILEVDVNNSYETLFAFPNGYFSCDLDPFENYLFAKHMQTEFDYRLFGIGASHIAYIKTKELTDDRIQKLIEFLQKIYRNQFDMVLINLLNHYIKNNALLVLRYTE